ncbi:MAG: PilW family protein [Planctomycetota bacterium]|jgi:type II secretory pathway pseudopilin PulG
MPKIPAARGSYYALTKMKCQENRKSLCREHRASIKALTLVEMVMALAMMAIVFAAIVPLFRQVRVGWGSKQAAAETLQNGRILIDHLNRNLSKAVRITAVSDSSETDGYIEFEDNDANNLRYDVNGATNYVEFGYIGDLSDLAGPVSKLQFTCYDACDLDTALDISTADLNDVRFVKAETTLTNPAAASQDKTLIASAYLRTNGDNRTGISKGTPFEYDAFLGNDPAIVQIDPAHYLCAYQGAGFDGYAVVLTVDTGDWTISRGTALEHDEDNGEQPALAKIDGTHYLCVYKGPKITGNTHGRAVVLTVDTGTWTISKGTVFDFDEDNTQQPALAQIDSTHYLCVYRGPRIGPDQYGYAIVLTIDTGDWTISDEGRTPFGYSDYDGTDPALAKIDGTHYLCAYSDGASDGQAVVLTVDTGDWSIGKATPLEYDAIRGGTPALAKIDTNHYLCAYAGQDWHGYAVVLTVDTGTGTISKGAVLEHDTARGVAPALAQIDSTRYLCAYQGADSNGSAIVLTVDTDGWTVSEGTAFEHDTPPTTTSDLAKIDDDNYLCAYTGQSTDGWSVVLTPGGGQLRP